ncbi:hypothetical protein L1049_021323 [Liquidambar formosana]|uniref:Protein kinase domain-containing protein n=1 Tax=Liquidambar formosana TaxID=63359 RepID=A0AAP0S9F9_LIQFO
MESAGCCVLKEFSYKDLKILTNSFSGENFIGRTQFGKVYRGKIQQGWKGMEAQDVTVKIWEVPVIMERGQLVDRTSADENRSRLTDEITFLGQPSVKSHPNLVKLMGYCCEDEQLGIVYDLRSFDTVHNLAVKDSFNWLHRVKVALGFAHLLEFLHSHEPEYLVRNITAAHIMVDEDFNPKLFDFAMLTGGVLGDKTCIEPHYVYGSYGYIDPRFFYSDLALRCVNCSLTPRPKMREVIGELHDLCVVRGSVDMLPYWVYRINADTLGIN